MSATTSLTCAGLLAAALLGSSPLAAQRDGPAQLRQLPDPDGKPADLRKKVKVFVLLGQSNMLGRGKVGPETDEKSLQHAVRVEQLYPFLVGEDGEWTQRNDVRNVRVMVGRGGGMRVFNNEWMTIKGRHIGPEIGIGHHLGNLLDEPVLVLKSCIGNRSLGWDLLPPGSERFEHDGKVYAGYKDSPDSWEKGTDPEPIGWYAGKQYDDDIANAKKVLDDLEQYYPGARGYEVAGFFWWQGAKDCGNAAHSERYEHNLVRLIERLREDFAAPKAKFVCATLGHVAKGDGGNNGKVLEAQLAVDGQRGEYPQHRGNVATVYSHPYCRGGSANSHYDGDARTYMDIGLAMGEAMVALLAGDK